MGTTLFRGVRIKGSRFRIFGFSCVHFGDQDGHDKDLWRQFLERVEATENAVVIGLGDYLDWTRTTYRSPLAAVWGEDEKARQEYDSMVMAAFVYPFVDTIRKHCPTFSAKCLGLLEGNHHAKMLSHRFQKDGRTGTEIICGLLGTEYLGLSAWIRLATSQHLGAPSRFHGNVHNLNLVATHSTSSSGTLPASLASAQRLMGGLRGVDVFLTANDHRLGHDLIQMLGCTQRGRPKMMQHEMVVGKVGSFQKGYTEVAEGDSYVEKKFLRPSRLGWLEFDAWTYEPGAHGKADVRVPKVWRYGEFNA